MNKYKKILKLLHAAWLILWLLVLLLMLLPSSATIIIFAPFALVIGLLGHLFLFIIHTLYNMSNRVKSKTLSPLNDGGWPWQIILAIVTFGYIIIYKLILANLFSPAVFTVYSMLLNMETSQNAQNKMGVPLGYILYWLVQVTVFLIALYGLVFRLAWAYRLIQGLCLILIVAVTGAFIFYAFSNSPAHYLSNYLPFFVILLSAYMYSFSKSKKVKQYFGLIEEAKA